MNKITKGLVVAAGITAVVALSGCSSNVSTDPDQVALHYTKGVTTGQQFEDCVPAGTFRKDGYNDLHYPYPTNQRTYDASDAQGAEGPVITVKSSDGQELKVPAALTFHLITACDDWPGYKGGTFRAFHEKLGLRYKAYWEEETPPEGPKGWLTMLQFVHGKSLDTALDRQAVQYDWRKLTYDPATKVKIESQVGESVQGLIDQIAGGHYFEVDNVRLQSFEPTNDQLKANVAAQQSAIAEAQTAKAKAEAQEAAAEAQVAVAKAQAAQVQEQIKVLGLTGYLETLREANRQRAIEKNLNPYPSPIVAGVGAR